MNKRNCPFGGFTTEARRTQSLYISFPIPEDTGIKNQSPFVDETKSLHNILYALAPQAETFLFVVVSRQTKKETSSLCPPCLCGETFFYQLSAFSFELYPVHPAAPFNAKLILFNWGPKNIFQLYPSFQDIIETFSLSDHKDINPLLFFGNYVCDAIS